MRYYHVMPKKGGVVFLFSDNGSVAPHLCAGNAHYI